MDLWYLPLINYDNVYVLIASAMPLMVINIVTLILFSLKNSKLLSRFTETIHYFYLFNGIVARKCQQIDFYQTSQTLL